MVFFRRLCRTLALPLAAMTFMASVHPVPARAGLVGTETVLERSAAAADRARVQRFMARADVRQQMQTLGIDADEASARVGAMTDEEVARVVGQLDQMPAGADGVGVVLGAILLVFLVLLVTDILGLTHVYPFTTHRGG